MEKRSVAVGYGLAVLTGLGLVGGFAAANADDNDMAGDTPVVVEAVVSETVTVPDGDYDGGTPVEATAEPAPAPEPTPDPVVEPAPVVVVEEPVYTEPVEVAPVAPAPAPAPVEPPPVVVEAPPADIDLGAPPIDPPGGDYGGPAGG